MQKDWFEKWFDSPYYHEIYEDRDREEAQKFVDNITEELHLPDNATICDLACGKGRYSSYLHSLGYDVIGLDLSENSIEEAKKLECNGLQFYQHDMRNKFKEEVFDVVFNFFTSFGYFEKDDDHIQTLEAVKYSLKEGGVFLIDFLNIHRIREELIPSETKSKNDTTFKINRWVNNGFLFKKIHILDKNREMSFTERVRAYHLEDFKKMIETVGMSIKNVYGDYSLKAYDEKESPRLIIIAEK